MNKKYDVEMLDSRVTMLEKALKSLGFKYELCYACRDTLGADCLSCGGYREVPVSPSGEIISLWWMKDDKDEVNE